MGYSQIMANHKLFCIYLFGLWCLRDVGAVKITSLDVPKNAWDAVKLNCKYDLEGDTLYGVKWYKDNREFFRCLADGSVQEFPLADIKIYHSERSQLGSCFFELTALTPRSGGEYTCEVSLDWPTFKTDTKSARLQVVGPSKIVQPEVTEGAEAVTPRMQNKGCMPLASVNIFIVFVILRFLF